MRTISVTPSEKNVGKDADMMQRLNAINVTVQRDNAGKIQSINLPDVDAANPDRANDARAIMSEFGHTVGEEGTSQEA